MTAGLSKTAAVRFLRRLAQAIAAQIPNADQCVADLRRIADRVEDNRWTRDKNLDLELRRQVARAAYFVERRNGNESVTAALNRHAKLIDSRCRVGKFAAPKDKKESLRAAADRRAARLAYLRALIVEARKQQRKPGK